MNFTIYIDDSGTSPEQKMAIATAFIVPAKQIVRMESEWQTLKQKEGFSDFHTSEFVNSRNNGPNRKQMFDYMEPGNANRKEIESAFKYTEFIANTEHNLYGEFTNYRFNSRKTLAGLQCVDLLGWTCYRYALYSVTNVPLHPYARIAWQYFGGPEHTWMDAGTMFRPTLEAWIKKELSKKQ